MPLPFGPLLCHCYDKLDTMWFFVSKSRMIATGCPELSWLALFLQCWVARQPSGFAFIEFEDDRDAEDALKLDGTEIKGTC